MVQQHETMPIARKRRVEREIKDEERRGSACGRERRRIKKKERERERERE